MLNDQIRNDLFKLWQSDYYLTDKERGRLWLIATGALKQMNSNKGYYDALTKDHLLDYPNPGY